MKKISINGNYGKAEYYVWDGNLSHNHSVNNCDTLSPEKLFDGLPDGITEEDYFKMTLLGAIKSIKNSTFNSANRIGEALKSLEKKFEENNEILKEIPEAIARLNNSKITKDEQSTFIFTDNIDKDHPIKIILRLPNDLDDSCELNMRISVGAYREINHYVDFRGIPESLVKYNVEDYEVSAIVGDRRLIISEQESCYDIAPIIRRRRPDFITIESNLPARVQIEFELKK